MNIKDRIKSVSFWAGIVGAAILVLGAFGVEIADETAHTVVNAVCSLLVFLGIASAPKKAENDGLSAPTDTLDITPDNEENAESEENSELE